MEYIKNNIIKYYNPRLALIILYNVVFILIFVGIIAFDIYEIINNFPITFNNLGLNILEIVYDFIIIVFILS